MKHTFLRRVLATAALAIPLALQPSLARADGAFPDHPMTFVVPFPAGSATDQLARALAASVTEQTHQPVIVENRAGANGMMAAHYVASLPGSGYAVMITTNTTQAANRHLFRKVPYDADHDFKPVTGLGRGGMVMVVRSDAAYRSVDDVVKAARTRPGKLSFGSGNSSSRVAGELFKQLSGTDVLYVPYKGNPQAIIDLMGGQIDFMIADTVTGLPQIESGKLRALGVSTEHRNRLLPNVPTIAESGVRGYDIGYWFAAYVPAATPDPVVEKIRALLATAVGSREAKGFFATSGTDPWTTTQSELAAFQSRESQKWGGVIKAAGIEPE